MRHQIAEASNWKYVVCPSWIVFRKEEIAMNAYDYWAWYEIANQSSDNKAIPAFSNEDDHNSCDETDSQDN